MSWPDFLAIDSKFLAKRTGTTCLSGFGVHKWRASKRSSKMLAPSGQRSRAAATWSRREDGRRHDPPVGYSTDRRVWQPAGSPDGAILESGSPFATSELGCLSRGRPHDASSTKAGGDPSVGDGRAERSVVAMA